MLHVTYNKYLIVANKMLFELKFLGFCRRVEFDLNILCSLQILGFFYYFFFVKGRSLHLKILVF